MRGVRAIPGINPPAKVCNKGQRERVAVKANRRTNKGDGKAYLSLMRRRSGRLPAAAA